MQVVLGYQLLAVAEFGDTLGHSLGLFRSQFQSQFIEVLDDVSLTGICNPSGSDGSTFKINI